MQAAKVLTNGTRRWPSYFPEREEHQRRSPQPRPSWQSMSGKVEEARKGHRRPALPTTIALRTQLNALNPGFLVTSIRNAPVMDMMNASEKVKQILLPNLYNDQPFKQIPRVDRCTTCHLGIDNKKNANNPSPFKTHPNLDLYLASASPHPMEKFGCTSCHGGLDRATDFPDCRTHPTRRKAEGRVDQEVRLAYATSF